MKTVFIAEDQTILRDLITRLLTGHAAIKVIGSAGDGEVAYQQCLELKPDIVVLDVMLPSLNGIEILRRLKSKLPSTRILVFSEAQSKNLIRQVIQAGVDVFIEKDVELFELEKAIDHVIRGESYFGPRITQTMRDIMLNPAQDNTLESLTSRERQVLQLIAEGHTSKEIAQILQISYKTADTHRAHIMDKLDRHNVAELTRYAISVGLTDKYKIL